MYKFFDLSEEVDFDLIMLAGGGSGGSSGSGSDDSNKIGDAKFKLTILDENTKLKIYRSACLQKVTIDNEADNSVTIESVDAEQQLNAKQSLPIALDNRVGFIQTYPMELVEVDVLNLGDYKVTASTNMKGVKAVNKLDRDVYFNYISQAQDSFVVDHTEVVISNTNIAQEWVEPIEPELPTPLHSNNVKITSAIYDVTIVPDGENVYVENIGSEVLWYSVPKGSATTNLNSGAGIDITAYKVFSNDENLPEYIEPQQEPEPIPEQYGYIAVVSVNGYIDVTASSGKKVKVVNNTGGSLLVGTTSIDDGSSLIIADNTTIKEGA